ncbi:MAG: N-acetylmuramoyl-L-alanine amidase [Bacteroidales bacterium]
MPSNLTVITDKQRNHCIKRFRSLTFLMIIVLLTSIDNLPGFAQSSPGKKFTVTIDAGHGGHDTGAPGKKSVEKNIALGITLKLGHYIENMMDDVDVYYTRKTDIFIPLYERAQIANRNKSDVFISIHVNANKKSTPTGTSTYVMGFSRSAENLDLVMQENKAILLEKDYQTKYAGFDPTSPESYIIFNNVQNNNLTQSLEIAAAVQDQLRTRGQRKDIGVHQGNLVVLWGCAKPSVLVETGFISNPQEEEFLMTDDGQDIIASAIFMAFREYKESVDEKVSVLAKTAIPTEAEKKVVENEKKGKEQEKAPIKDQVKVTSNPVDTISRLRLESEIEYRVQILASVKKLSPDAKDFKGVKDLKEIKLDGYYKYMSQSVNTYQEALELRRKLGASFRGAFIVAFKNGERVPLNTNIDQRKN